MGFPFSKGSRIFYYTDPNDNMVTRKCVVTQCGKLCSKNHTRSIGELVGLIDGKPTKV